MNIKEMSMRTFSLAGLTMLLTAVPLVAKAVETQPAHQTILVTSIDVKSVPLPDTAHKKIEGITKEYTQKSVTFADLTEVRERIQTLLDTLHAGLVVTLPGQEIKNGIVEMLIGAKLQFVSAEAKPGYPADSQILSLPSLQKDKALYPGQPWFDHRELAMAQENPLKRTDVNFNMGSQGASALLKVNAPYGAVRRYVSVDNYGSAVTGRPQLSAGIMNANLTGRNDVFDVNLFASLNAPSKSNAFSLSYKVPFYSLHQTVGVNVVHASSNYSNLPINQFGDFLGVRGTFDQFALNWNYFLPTSTEANQFKVFVSYAFRQVKSSQNLNDFPGFDIVDYRINEAPFTVGLSGKLKPRSDINLAGQVSLTHNAAGWFGASDSSAYNNQLTGRTGLTGSYSLVNYSFLADWDVRGWNASIRWNGQWTQSPLLWNDLMGITGPNAVRGFQNTTLAAEKANVLRLQLQAPKLPLLSGVKPYAFYDVGRMQQKIQVGGVDSSSAVNVASVGLGVTAELVPNSVLIDAYVAQVIEGQHRNISYLGQTASNSPSFWLSAVYNF